MRAARNVPDWMVRQESGAPVVYRLLTDERGSVRLVVRMSNGEVVQQFDYDAWGRMTVVKDTSAFPATGMQLHPFGYAGGLYDPVTGLVRFGARDYDPQVGRWTNKDPSGFAGGLNLYAYAAGDPINYVDIDGRSPMAVEATIGVVMGIAIDVIYQRSQPGYQSLNWMEVFGAGVAGGIIGASGGPCWKC